MARDARFTCRFPAHALGVAERLGDAARLCGLVTWTSPHGDDFEIRFEGPREKVQTFAAQLGLRNEAIMDCEPPSHQL